MPNTIASKVRTANTMKIKKKTLAILEAPDSTPLKPIIPAITEITKNTKA